MLIGGVGVYNFLVFLLYFSFGGFGGLGGFGVGGLCNGGDIGSFFL